MFICFFPIRPVIICVFHIFMKQSLVFHLPLLAGLAYIVANSFIGCCTNSSMGGPFG